MKASRTYDRYYLYSEIEAILKGYEKDYPEFTRLESLAVTAEGRNIWAISVTDTRCGDFADKPAYCIDGNIHAGEVTGSMVAMHFLDLLYSNLENDEIRKLLMDYTFYVIPRISPDGSDVYLTTPEMLRSVNHMYPFEELMPGVQPCDLDGDGVIRRMRIKSPYGNWKVSSDDPRLMVKRGPDDIEGDFYNVFNEGMVEDYDGVVIKQAPSKWGNDFNRNFPFAWVPEPKQAGAGTYPLINTETKAMADFTASHKNICCILNMHTMGGFYLYPPGYKSGKEAYKEDMAVYEALGKMGTEESTYPAINIRDNYVPVESGPICGLFDDFNHFVMGLINFTIECWDLYPRVGIPHTFPTKIKNDEQQYEQMKKVYEWADENLGKEVIMPWTEFEHPQLGKVEIGGYDYKTLVQNCPPKFLQQEVEKHGRFILRAAKAMPRLDVRGVKVTPIGDAWKVEACVYNSRFLPTYVTKEALNLKIVGPVKATIEGEGVEIIEGKAVMDLGQLEGFSGIKNGASSGGQVSIVGAPCEKKVSWIVKASAGTEVTVSFAHPRAGKAEAKIIL
ncbi:MAG: zinc carboxypeptidase [Clostridia bacterium]|nr:zinc carboxypeptidase [Clostridia bacterium]